MTSMVDDAEECPVCKQGHFIKREEDMAFLQWTDKGLVRCCATITVAVCEGCGFKTWDEDAERRLNDAVRHEYAKRR